MTDIERRIVALDRMRQGQGRRFIVAPVPLWKRLLRLVTPL